MVNLFCPIVLLHVSEPPYTLSLVVHILSNSTDRASFPKSWRSSFNHLIQLALVLPSYWAAEISEVPSDKLASSSCSTPLLLEPTPSTLEIQVSSILPPDLSAVAYAFARFEARTARLCSLITRWNCSSIHLYILWKGTLRRFITRKSFPSEMVKTEMSDSFSECSIFRARQIYRQIE